MSDAGKRPDPPEKSRTRPRTLAVAPTQALPRTPTWAPEDGPLNNTENENAYLDHVIDMMDTIRAPQEVRQPPSDTVYQLPPTTPPSRHTEPHVDAAILNLPSEPTKVLRHAPASSPEEVGTRNPMVSGAEPERARAGTPRRMVAAVSLGFFIVVGAAGFGAYLWRRQVSGAQTPAPTARASVVAAPVETVAPRPPLSAFAASAQVVAVPETTASAPAIDPTAQGATRKNETSAGSKGPKRPLRSSAGSEIASDPGAHAAGALPLGAQTSGAAPSRSPAAPTTSAVRPLSTAPLDL